MGTEHLLASVFVMTLSILEFLVMQLNLSVLPAVLKFAEIGKSGQRVKFF